MVKNIHKEKIMIDIIIINPEVPVLSFKNPPGKLRIPIVNNIKNTTKDV